MNKNIIIGIVVVVLVVGGIFWFIQNQNNAINNPSPAPVVTQTPTTTPAPNPTPNPVPSPASAAVTISNFVFSPATLTVHKGATVTWTNNDSASHTVTGDNGGPSSSPLSQGATYSYTFNTVGSFPYHCSIHPSMKATVQVVN